VSTACNAKWGLAAHPLLRIERPANNLARSHRVEFPFALQAANVLGLCLGTTDAGPNLNNLFLFAVRAGNGQIVD